MPSRSLYKKNEAIVKDIFVLFIYMKKKIPEMGLVTADVDKNFCSFEVLH